MKFIKFCTSAIFAVLLSTGFVNAETPDSGSSGLFTVSMGLSYRHFSDIDFEHPYLIGPAAASDLNALRPDSAAARQELVGTSTAPFVAISCVPASKESEDADIMDSILPTFSFSYGLCEQEGMFLSLISNLQLFDLDVKSKNIDSFHTNVIMTHDNSLGAVGPGIGPRHSLSMKADIQGLVWDLGLQTTLPLQESLDLNIGIGPSLNFVSMDTSFSSYDSNVDKIVPGLYVSAGLTYWLDSNYGVTVDLRYDKVFDEIKTRYASFDLDSFSGGVKFTYSF